MSEKKDAAITLHLPQRMKDQLARLATHERIGMGEGEYVMGLVMTHLQTREAEAKVMQEIFCLKGNDQNRQ